MDRSAIPRPKGDYKLVELEGESMLYHSGDGKALYLNETASVLWKLCDGQRTVAAIEGLLKGAYPEAQELPEDVDAAFHLLIGHGALEVP
ncbi:MAG TPA: PqqD family peptide modification chaperone [Candidatus Acidoferrales bacterium]|nr:PqqD family peptide modification chaperone [Candidatus Acidoferrales bacterium]